MFRGSRCFYNNFRTQKVTDRLSLVMAKKEVEYDHIAVDMNGMVGAALRMAKNCPTEARRNSEVSRAVKQSLQNLLKKFHPKKSLLIVMDGAEPIWKASKTRSANLTKKIETRFLRLPGSSLMLAIEDKVTKMMPDTRLCPAEIVFSGTSVPGPVEQKFSAWALDLADRDSTKSSDTICLIGGTDLFLNTMALTPFYNISSVVQNNADFKQLTIQEVLEWLCLDEVLKDEGHAVVAKMRTDIVFLYALCNGVSATDVPGVPGINFADVMERYLSHVKKSWSSAAVEGTEDPEKKVAAKGGKIEAPTGKQGGEEEQEGESGSGSSQKAEPFHLFKEDEQLSLNLQHLYDVLVGVKVQSQGGGGGASGSSGSSTVTRTQDKAATTFLQLHLQSHSLLCKGHVPDPLFGAKVDEKTSMVDAPISTAQLLTAVPLSSLLGLLQHLLRNGESYIQAQKQKLSKKTLPNSSLQLQQLTAAEYSMLSHSQPPAIESFISTFVGTQSKPEVGKKVVAATEMTDALQVTRDILSFAHPMKAHKSMYHSPSYVWLQHPKSKMWNFHYVDIGQRSLENQTRRRKNSEATAVNFSVSSDGPVSYDVETKSWVPLGHFPAGNTASNFTPPSRLNVVTWNVMFDRYSGKPTPLGMPGIDWCSPKRYPILSKILKNMDADVIGMQEVEPQFWEYLAAQPWVQENYIFSCNVNGPSITPWGVLMMVHKRQQVTGISHANVPAFSGHMCLMPIINVRMAHANVSIASIHLLAPYTKTHENARTGQDNVLRQRMAKSCGPEAIVMGDYNDWPTSEFTMPPESNYVDCWPIVKPNDMGKTMDETNEFCKLKIEEIFFGRSDKLFLRSPTKKLVPIQASLIGTKSVNAENGDHKAPGYLFPSDHYGVQMLFSVK